MVYKKLSAKYFTNLLWYVKGDDLYHKVQIWTAYRAWTGTRSKRRIVTVKEVVKLVPIE